MIFIYYLPLKKGKSMVVELLPTCQELIRRSIKNPPTYHKGNQMVMVPYSVFCELENAIRAQELAQSALESDETSNKDNDADDDLIGAFIFV